MGNVTTTAAGSIGGLVGHSHTVPMVASDWYNSYPAYPTPAPATFPHNTVANFIGLFRVRQVENGYIVECQLRPGEAVREYFAETLKDVGERICALGVQKAVEGEKKP